MDSTKLKRDTSSHHINTVEPGYRISLRQFFALSSYISDLVVFWVMKQKKQPSVTVRASSNQSTTVWRGAVEYIHKLFKTFWCFLVVVFFPVFSYLMRSSWNKMSVLLTFYPKSYLDKKCELLALCWSLSSRSTVLNMNRSLTYQESSVAIAWTILIQKKPVHFSVDIHGILLRQTRRGSTIVWSACVRHNRCNARARHSTTWADRSLNDCQEKMNERLSLFRGFEPGKEKTNGVESHR